MSPQLLLYLRLWECGKEHGWRLSPKRLLLTGLELGLWMTAASLAGLVALAVRCDQEDRGISFGSVLLPILMVTTILCRSTGALSPAGLRHDGPLVVRRFRTRLLLAGLLVAGPLYVGCPRPEPVVRPTGS